jgi:hypothetical protein
MPWRSLRFDGAVAKYQSEIALKVPAIVENKILLYCRDAD